MCWLRCGLYNQETSIKQIIKKKYVHTHTQILNCDYVPKEKIPGTVNVHPVQTGGE